MEVAHHAYKRYFIAHAHATAYRMEVVSFAQLNYTPWQIPTPVHTHTHVQEHPSALVNAQAQAHTHANIDADVETSAGAELRICTQTCTLPLSHTPTHVQLAPKTTVYCIILYVQQPG